MGGKIRGIMALGLAVGAGVLGVWGLSAGCAEAENDIFQRPDCPRPAPGCGDGCVDVGLRETCDDGNRMNGDGCDSSCHRETGADADADADVRADADADAVTETTETTDTAPRDDGWAPDTASCPETPCRLWPQCGCDPGQKCTIDPSSTSTTLIKMCNAAGSSTMNDTCTADEECSVGTGCFGLYSDTGTVTMGMCFHYCAAHSDCTGSGAYCLPMTTTASFPGMCTHACNLTSGSGCPSGTKCGLYGLEGSTDSFTDCTSDVGYGSAGSSCYQEGDCRAGTFCATSIGECIAYCTGIGSSCSGGICNSFTDPAVIGGVEYGYCYY